ncbi:MAG: M50 family metallopeptidase [bacterium]|nr:M50 family metallopeptidase [bacterium]
MRLWVVLGTGIAITLFWEWILPVKLLVVLVHEIWHGAAALLSGAVLDQIDVDLAESGETLVSGLYSTSGFVFSVSAGYLGTALVGALLLARGLAGEWERVTVFVFAGLLLYMSYLFANVGSIAFYAGIGWGVGWILLGLLGQLSARLTLLVFGTIFLWYCFYDLFDFTRDIGRTDAGILARYIQAQAWPGVGDWSMTALASTVSLVWCAGIFGILAIVLGPILGEMAAATPAPPAAEEAPPGMGEPGMPDFPGELTPDVQEWLLMNGFGLDGRPLPPELLEESPPANELPNTPPGAGQSAGGA